MFFVTTSPHFHFSFLTPHPKYSCVKCVKYLLTLTYNLFRTYMVVSSVYESGNAEQ